MNNYGSINTNEDIDIESNIPICYICCDEGDLIAPCGCKSGLRYVHQHCIDKWVKQMVDDDDIENEELKVHCRVCLQQYNTAVVSMTFAESFAATDPILWIGFLVPNLTCLVLFFHYAKALFNATDLTPTRLLFYSMHAFLIVVVMIFGLLLYPSIFTSKKIMVKGK